jgi:hypothetical protein
VPVAPADATGLDVDDDAVRLRLRSVDRFDCEWFAVLL